MVLLGRIERTGGDDLRHDGLVESPRRLELLLRGQRELLLRVVVIEDGRAILRSAIAELRVRGDRIDVVPERVEQALVAHPAGIEHDAHGFGVPRSAVGHLLVRGIGDAPARVPRRRRDDPGHLVERLLHAPETAAGKGGRVQPRALRRRELIPRVAARSQHHERRNDEHAQGDHDLPSHHRPPSMRHPCLINRCSADFRERFPCSPRRGQLAERRPPWPPIPASAAFVPGSLCLAAGCRTLAGTAMIDPSQDEGSMTRRLLLALALGAAGCAPVTAQNPAPSPAPDAAAAAAAQGPQGPGARGSLKKFDELVKGATARTGFFDTYEKDGRIYLAIPPSRLGEQFALTYEIAQGMGSRNVIGGTMLNYFDASAVSLERKGDKVVLLDHPIRYTAPAGSPTAKSVELTFSPSVLDAAKIESMRPDSAVVIDITDWMLSDLSNVGERVRAAVAPRPGAPGRATIDKNRSYIESVKVFPENMNIRAKLTFTPGEPVDIQSVADSRYLPVSIFYSFAKLPAEPMRPRVADDRLGYYMTVHKDFTSTDDSFFRRYVHKWRLEPGRQAGTLWEPKKPIIYYIDRTVPEEYRPYVKQGVEAWNAAFEAAGFKNAIRAEPLPDSADAEDIRFATIRWNTSDIPDYGAIGPSMTDPRTGEVLDADILFEQSMIQNFRRSWRTVASPAMSAEAVLGVLAPEATTVPGAEMALFGPMLSAQGTLLRAVLAADGEIEANDAVPHELVGQAIAWVTMHEVGHTLGLRHNFRSSSDTPLDKLYDADFTKANGIYSSVMEYPSLNLAPRGTKNGIFYNTGVGTYDKWVIAYGYTPDDDRAEAIAREAARAGHAYGTDEDAVGPGAMDPSVTPFDLSADPLGWGKERAALIASLFPKLPERVLTDNSRYADLTDALGTLYGQYAQAVAPSVKYLGGQYVYRDHAGDPDGRKPFVPVPRAKQLEALEFLTTAGFGEKAFPVPTNVLAQLGANRWSHWGQQNTFQGRIDFPWHEQVLQTQRALLNGATQPFVFARIRDAELKFGARNVVTIPELMGGLTNAIWSEVSAAPRNITSIRRDLQRAYLDRMTDIVVGDPPRLPADARAVGRAQLTQLKRRIDARVAAGAALDAYTRAHLAESSARIGKILEAGLTESVPTAPPRPGQ